MSLLTEWDRDQSISKVHGSYEIFNWVFSGMISTQDVTCHYWRFFKINSPRLVSFIFSKLCKCFLTGAGLYVMAQIAQNTPGSRHDSPLGIEGEI